MTSHARIGVSALWMSADRLRLSDLWDRFPKFVLGFVAMGRGRPAL